MYEHTASKGLKYCGCFECIDVAMGQNLCNRCSPEDLVTVGKVKTGTYFWA